MGIAERFSRRKAVAVALIAVFLVMLAVLGTVFRPGTLVGSQQIQYTSNDPFFDANVLLIEQVADKSTEELNIQFSESELESETGEDFESGVSIEVTEQDSKSRYEIQDNDLKQVATLEAIQGYVYSDRNDPGNLEVANWARENCYDIRGTSSVNNKDRVVRSLGWTFSGYRYEVSCFTTKEILGQVGDISADQVIFEADVRVQYGDKEPQTATISNADIGEGSVVRVGEHVVITTGAGMPTGKNSYATDDEYALYTSDDQWRIIEKSGYNRYVNYMEVDTNLYSQLEAWANDDISETEAEQQVNNLAYSAASEFSSSRLASGDFQGDFNTGVLTVNYDKSLIWPSIIYHINGGEYVTIEKPIGSPSITRVSSDDIAELGGGKVYATIKNTADKEGSFTVRVRSCTPDFQPTDFSTRERFAPGEEKQFSFLVSFESDSDTRKEISGSCTIEAKNSVGTTVTQSVSVTGVQENKCEPDHRYRDVVNGEEVIRMCTSDGLPGEILETCDGETDKIESVDGQLQCVDHETDGPGATDPPVSGDCMFTIWANPVGDDVEVRNPFCGGSGLLGGLASTVHLILSVVIGGLLGKIGYRWSRRFDGERQIRGSFQPFKNRSVSRVERGRFIVGIAGGVTAFLVGFFLSSQLSIGLQIAALIGVVILDDRSRVRRAGGYAKTKTVESVKNRSTGGR